MKCQHLIILISFLCLLGILFLHTKKEIIIEKEIVFEKEIKNHLIEYYQGPLISYFNPECPRYIHVPINQNAGLGHRLINWCVNKMIAEFFNLTMVVTSFEGHGDHGSYPGADDFFGLMKGEIRLADLFGVQFVNLMDFPQTPKISDMFIPFKNSISPYENQCNIIFMQKEIWVPSLLPVKFIALKKFQESIKNNPYELIYKKDKLNLAIHIRIGDNHDTPMNYFPTILTEIIDIFYPIVPQVYIFSEGSDFIELSSFKNIQYVNLGALESFYHLTQSDLTICSASSFCTIASLLSIKPLFLLSPDRPQDLDYKTCTIGNICLSNKEGKMSQTEISFLRDFLIRWIVKNK